MFSFASYDYIEVFDGGEELSDKLGRFCGSNKPLPFVSTGNELLLKFKSDDTVNWKGFHAVYKLVDPLSEESVAPTQSSANVSANANKNAKRPTEVNSMVINTADAASEEAGQNILSEAGVNGHSRSRQSARSPSRGSARVLAGRVRGSRRRGRRQRQSRYNL